MPPFGQKRIVLSFLVTILAAGAALAQDLTAGKTPAQLFAGGCTACHKGPQGLAKDGSARSIGGFLRQHYTSSPEMAEALAVYLLAAGPAARERPQHAAPVRGRPATGDNGARRASREPAATPPAARPPAARPPAVVRPPAAVTEEKSKPAQTATAPSETENAGSAHTRATATVSVHPATVDGAAGAESLAAARPEDLIGDLKSGKSGLAATQKSEERAALVRVSRPPRERTVAPAQPLRGRDAPN
ncbi:MAG: hypothetical protein HY056_15860 [Proteobacteria bacterium]|nr:hypothetical protein [Pseudomonadota bacterium]